MPYSRIAVSSVPSPIRFDVPRVNQGQIIEVAYADWPTRRYEAASGSTFKRVTDQSLPVGDPDRVTYYRNEEQLPRAGANGAPLRDAPHPPPPPTA